MLFWGMSYVWSKVVFEYYSPLTTVFLRLVLSSAFLFLYILIMKKAQKVRKADLGLFFFSALFNPFLYFLGESYGLDRVSPTISAVIIATIPLFTPVLAYFTLKEKISFVYILGILISFAGILLMLLEPDMSFRTSPLGVLFLFGGVASAIIYTVILRKLSFRYSPLCIITYQNFIGIFYFLPFFLIFHYDHFITVKPNRELILSLIQLAVFASSMAFIFYTIGVRNLGMNKANVYTNLIPVFSAVTSYYLLNEVFDVNKIAGMGVVIGGLLLSQLKQIKRNNFGIFAKNNKR